MHARVLLEPGGESNGKVGFRESARFEIGNQIVLVPHVRAERSSHQVLQLDPL
jgi:hypothetical protein